MSQKEIIHLSFGTFANHVSTHYWNQQQQYFDYSQQQLDPFNKDKDADVDQQNAPLVDHDVSFRAGIGANGVETYTPRTLIFDTSDEMGGLKRINQLYDDLDAGNQDGLDSVQTRLNDGLNTWSQPASLQRTANPIPKSNYQKRLEREDLGLEVDSDEELSDLDDDFDQEDSTTQGQTTTATTSPSTSIPNENKISRKSRQKQREEAEKREYGYWSNYNRSFFHPNSILTIGGQLLAPMIGSSSSSSYTNEQGLSLDEVEDGRNRFESWEFGVRMFDETEKESQILDNSLRFQSEDCDSLQSFQLFSTVNDAFSGFSFRMLEELNDEYSKNERILWGLGWGEEDWRDEFGGGSEGRRLANFRRMNSILSLSNFSDLSSLYVPLRTPNFNIRNMSKDSRPSWSKHLGRLNLNNMWQSSALLSDGIESLTLGMRLRSKPFTTAHLISTLNWRRDTPLASLGICLPSPTLDASSGSTSKVPMDPIDALLASRGYGPKPSRGERGRIETSAEKAKRGAAKIKENWLDLSNLRLSSIRTSSRKAPGSMQVESKGGVPNLYQTGKELQDMQDYEKLKDDRMKPFSQVVMIRGIDEESDQSKQEIMNSVEEWNQCDGPTGGSHHTSLPLNIPSSHPQFFSNLSSNGVELSSTSTSNPKVRSVPLVSSLNISSTLHSQISSSKKFLTKVIEGHEPLYNYGIGVRGSVGVASSDENDGNVGGRDGLKEIRERLEDLSSNYEMEGFENEDDDDERADGKGKDEDEEWQEKNDEEDWDL